MQWKNDLTQILGIDYPVIQGPMLAVTTPEMVAAISNKGGLGSLPVGGLSPQQTAVLIRKTKTLTNKPFAVNLFAHNIPAIDKQQVEDMQQFLEKVCNQNKIPFEKQSSESLRFYSYNGQVQILLDENIPVVSFTFGVLNDEAIKIFKEKGVVLIGTATCVKEAVVLDEKGIDVITAQGAEAGGHRGTFLKDEPLPMIGLMSLIPQLLSHLDKPVIAAGGINSGKSIKASFVLGAKGVQIGTAFIGSDESAAISSYKTAIQNASETDTVITRAFTGRWGRAIKNKFIEEVENSGMVIPDYPVQGGLVVPIRNFAQQHDAKDFIPLFAGQSLWRSEGQPAGEIFTQLIRQAEETENDQLHHSALPLKN